MLREVDYSFIARAIKESAEKAGGEGGREAPEGVKEIQNGVSRRALMQGSAAFGAAAGTGLLASAATSTPAEAVFPNFWDIFAPRPDWPVWPAGGNRDSVIKTVTDLSARLDTFVKGYLDGENDGFLTPDVLPENTSPDFKDWRVQRPEELDYNQVWGQRYAEPIDFNNLRGSFGDPNTTYLVIPYFYAPFGSKLIFEGEFPYCRFFTIQTTPPFAPEQFRRGAFGCAEVPFLDADIDPMPGHTNPFRIGADRYAEQRSYKVEYDLAIGDPVALNADPANQGGGAFTKPYYRKKGNQRVGGAIFYRGPWGDPSLDSNGKLKVVGSDGFGFYQNGEIWLRYYLPDAPKGPTAGVELPKVYCQLPDGRQYFITCDYSFYRDKSERRISLPRTKATAIPKGNEPSVGWDKQVGIFRTIVNGIRVNSGILDKPYVRELDLGTTGRGEGQGFNIFVPPFSFPFLDLEPSSTSAQYINYLIRGLAILDGYAIVLTGKLPTTPKTRNGDRTMVGAQARYWSLTGTVSVDLNAILGTLGNPADVDIGATGTAPFTVYDEQVVVDSGNNFVICLSREEDRPANATAENGVTWVDWGPYAALSWQLRWITCYPEYAFSKSPTEDKVGWKASAVSYGYDEKLLGLNNNKGFLGEYQPVIHYLKKEEFEALGGALTPSKIPEWVNAPTA